MDKKTLNKKEISRKYSRYCYMLVFVEILVAILTLTSFMKWYDFIYWLLNFMIVLLYLFLISAHNHKEYLAAHFAFLISVILATCFHSGVFVGSLGAAHFAFTYLISNQKKSAS